MNTDTPETDAEYHKSESICSDQEWGSIGWDLARKLERQRDELQSELNRIYHWIERRNQDGFIDSKGHIGNLDIVWDRLCDKLDNAESDAKQSDVDALRALHERNEARRERDEYATILCDAMMWVYGGPIPNHKRDEMIERFKALELTPGQTP